METPIGDITLGHGTSHPHGMALAVAIRPEKIRIDKTPPIPDSPMAANVVTGTVREIAYMGSYSTYVVDVTDGTVLKVTQANRSRDHEDDIVWGDRVYCFWDTQAGVLLAS